FRRERGMITPCRALIAILLIGMVGAPARAEVPLIPFHTSFTYWDHHWIQWLPTHPRFEAIEAAIAGGDDPSKRFIRVWLTERKSPKNQVYYFDNEAVLRTMRSGFVRQISFTIGGSAELPRALDLSLTDADGQPV